MTGIWEHSVTGRSVSHSFGNSGIDTGSIAAVSVCVGALQCSNVMPSIDTDLFLL